MIGDGAQGAGPGQGRATAAVVRAGAVSLVAGTTIMLVKFAAWAITDSAALFADATESIVNVLAGAMVLWSVVVSGRPADADHPYGHGRAESLSAVAEGAMIVIAAAIIAVSAISDMIVGPDPHEIGIGLAVAGSAGLANLVLGLWLLHVGHRESSEALHADGAHVLTDVVTTLGALIALALVKLTGFAMLDPIGALVVAGAILWTGWRVVRRALASLLNEADFDLLSLLAERLSSTRRPEWIDIHRLRTWSAGSFQHIDLHVIVPRYMTIEEAHQVGDAVEAQLLDCTPGEAEAVVHLDPCLPAYCTVCAIDDCPVRSAPFEKPFGFDVESLTRPDDPA